MPGTRAGAAPDALLELGRGGMGTAYLARAKGADRFERLVVVKRLQEHLVEVPQALERFLDEARLAAHVHHANVVGTQHVGRDALGPYLVLDYVEGSSLEGLVDRQALRGRAFPLPIALRIVLDALAGLEAVHTASDAKARELRMLHRDVTLQNVLVGRDGVSRIADFGIAKSALGSVVTDDRYLVGKLLYMAPEYLRRSAIDARLDVYALGVTLWLVLSGRELWAGASDAQLLAHILTDPLPPISSGALTIPPQIEQLVAKACAKDVAARYLSAREMAADIERIARETGWLASHAEVAELVEDLCGRDMAARRARVAELVGDAALGADGSNTAVVAESLVEPRRKLMVPGVLLFAALALGLVVYALRRALPSELPASAAAPAASTASTAAATPTTPVSVIEPEPSATAAPSASATPSVVPPTRRPTPSRPSEPLPRSVPSSQPATGGTPKPPDEVTKANPYVK
ncbi:MAG: serine/threonine protein kinase [Myxococcales bacterium]|nr:serine/threonine protein kinase [Myxococcales bacterium]